MKISLLSLGIAAVVLLGCGDEFSNSSSPREFFSKEQVGSAPDYALIKWNNPQDHVATAHGFADDGEGCHLMAEGLNRSACAETEGQNCRNPFSCVVITPRN